MAKGLIWATAEDLERNKSAVLSLYRNILRALNSRDLPLNLTARHVKKGKTSAIFKMAAGERSLHNIDDLMDAGYYTLSLLKKGQVPNER